MSDDVRSQIGGQIQECTFIYVKCLAHFLFLFVLILKVFLEQRRTFSELGKAEDSDSALAGTLECKHSCGSPYENKMVDALGIAPSSSVLKTDADLSQLNVPL